MIVSRGENDAVDRLFVNESIFDFGKRAQNNNCVFM